MIDNETRVSPQVHSEILAKVWNDTFLENPLTEEQLTPVKGFARWLVLRYDLKTIPHPFVSQPQPEKAAEGDDGNR